MHIKYARKFSFFYVAVICTIVSALQSSAYTESARRSAYPAKA